MTSPDEGPDADPVAETARRSVIRDSLGVGLAVGTYGVAFGAASVAAGLSVTQTVLLSLLAFTGGTQFAVVGVVAAGGGIAAALVNGLLLGTRNTLYAMRLAPLVRPGRRLRFVAALGTIDESTAMAIAQPRPALARTAFWWTFAGVYLFWNLSTMLGAVGAHTLGNPDRFGLDAVVPAAFLALLAPRLRTGRIERRVAIGGAAIAFVLIPFTPPGIPVLASCAALLLAGSVRGAPSRPRDLGRPDDHQ